MPVNPDDVVWPEEPIRDIREDEYPLSASATKTFNKCPEQYRLSYVEDESGSKGSSVYARMGSVIHEVIEETLLQNPSLTDKPNSLREVMIARYREKTSREELSGDYEDIFDDGLECLNVASRYIVQRDVKEWKGIEEEFRFGLKRPDINHGFRGIIDVATEREVWDWKTGKNSNETDEIIQGMIYAMGYYQMFGVVPRKIRFVYLRKETERAFDPTDENWQEMLNYVRDVVDAKKSGEYEPKPGPSKCSWCSVEGYCSASPVGAGGIRWEIF